MSISAMKQALEALENYINVVTSSNDPNDFGGVVDGGEPARKACDVLRQALAEAEKQEPDDIYDVWVEQKPVLTNDISQECVDETAKGKHDLWIAAACLKSTVESAIKAGDWKVDGACDPTRDLAYLADCLANPKREWVGLTKDEVDSWELPIVPTVFQFAQFVEAKLKEKNS